MTKLRKLFFETEFTWKRTIIFSIIAGFYTAIVAIPEFLENTSVADISATFEWWILFAIIIITNSKSNKDAAIKCFIFFLISQPLVYLIQVPFNPWGWGIFRYYKYWAIWTLATLPMGFIGYFLKKDNLLGLLVLSPMLLLLGVHFYFYFDLILKNPPYHLLTLIFIFASSYLFVNVIFTKKREIIIGNILNTIILIVATIVAIIR